MNRHHILLVALTILVTGCNDTDNELEKPDVKGKYVTLSATALNVGGQTRADATPVAVTDPVPVDTYTSFKLAYVADGLTPPAAGTDNPLAITGNAVVWTADKVALDFTPLEWRNIVRDGSTTATLTGISSTTDTRTTNAVPATVSGTFVVEANAFAPKAAITLKHNGARFAIVLKRADGAALTAADYTASMYTAADATAATTFSFKAGVNTKVEGTTETKLLTPYALLNLAPFTISDGKKTLTITDKNNKEVADITLTDLDVKVTTVGSDGTPATTTDKLTKFIAGQYLTLTVTLSNELELASTPTVTVTPWRTGEEWTLNGNK